jgi:GTPase SAR1 family protein
MDHYKDTVRFKVVLIGDGAVGKTEFLKSMNSD